jgi:hypothetical protein
MTAASLSDFLEFLPAGEALRIRRRDREIERHAQRRGNLHQVPPHLRERIIQSISARDQSAGARDRTSHHHDTHNRDTQC